MRKQYLCAALLGFVATASAQNYDADSVLYSPIEKQKSKKIQLVNDRDARTVNYFFNVQMGSLIGCNDCGRGKDVTFSAATTHGVTVGNKFRGGLGVGLDSYVNWQTIPVYAVVSWDVIGNKNRNAIYVQVSYGWAHPWFIRNGSYNNYTSDPFVGISGGRMVNPSLGYRLKYHDVNLSLGVGYKFQRIFYKTNSYYNCPYCDFGSYGQDLEITQDRNRVQIIMSVGWK